MDLQDMHEENKANKKKKIILASIVALITLLCLLWLNNNFALFNPDRIRGDEPDEATLAKASPIFAFEKTDINEAVIFAQVGDPFAQHPVILASQDKKWQLFDIKTAPFKQTQWIYAARGANTKSLWGLAENQNEGPGPAIEIVFSDDDGQSWRHLASIKKPMFLAKFHSFQMSKDGSGKFVLYLSDDSVDVEKIGYYVFTTSDWGKTWSEATYQADILMQPNFTFGADSETADLLSVKELMQNQGD